MGKGMVMSQFDCRVKVPEDLHEQILKLRIEGKTLMEIGETFGVSGERIGQILKKKLKEQKEISYQNG